MAFLLVGTLIDRWLASGFSAALATMQYATALVQFPLGLVAAAVGLAVLPTLARQAAADDELAFRQTLGMGLKLVLLLVVPAAAGLAALATPITALLFQRGAFGAADAAATATALLCYLPGLPATAIAQIVLFAFYARQNTLAPNLVQGAAILVYLLAALPLLWLTRLGFLALVLGNSAQWIGHMLLLMVLLRRAVPLHGLRLGEALGKALLAGGLMAAAILAIARSLPPGGPLLRIGVAGGLGALLYLALCVALRVEALGFFVQALGARFGGKQPR
jgi:putative peptidoglycan lipid II flippase